MKRFRFSLRPVAVLRAHHEMRAREAFAASVQAFVKSEQNLEAAKERLRRLGEELTAGRAVRFSAADEIHALVAYRRECAAETEAQQAVVQARKTMDERRADYVEAHRKLEVVRRLEQKARKLHQYELNREEQAEYDDFANRRFGRESFNSA